MNSRLSRSAGAVLLAGTLTWALTFAVWPSDSHHNSRPEIAGGLTFQIGVLAYLAALSAARAAGQRWGQRILATEATVLLLALAWSVGTLVFPSTHQGAVLTALDAAWPLSMVGLIVVAVAVARGGRWTGADRFAPLAASLWLPADAIGQALHAGRGVHDVWLIGTYGWVSWVLLRGPLRAPSAPGLEPVTSSGAPRSGASVPPA